ncbi:MAG: hypothetical protein ACJ797_06120 [Ktedonobacteraceae bacterium]
MDPVTTAIVAALAAGAISAVTEAGKKTVADTYEALKSLLKKKFGHESELVKSVESLETRPDSTARKNLLQEEVIAAKADQDPDILQAAQALLNQISTQPDGVKHIQHAAGSYIAQADRGSTASVNVNQPRG